MCAYVAAELEDGGEVHLEDSFPVFVWELVCRVPLLDAAAVEQDVDSVAVAEDGGYQGADGGLGGEVGSVDCGFAAEGFDLLFRGLVAGVALGGWLLVGGGDEERVERAYLDEENVCSCFCERESHGLTDTSCSACYEGGLALEREELLYGCHVDVLVGAVRNAVGEGLELK